MKILITGGTGYLGRILSEDLLDIGYEVVVLDNLLYGQIPPKNVIFRKGDITNLSEIVDASEWCDTIVALAAIVGDGACNIDIKRTFNTNIKGSENTLLACETNKIPKMIFASTCSVYGCGETILTEDSPTNPLSIYAHSRLDSENKLLDMNKNTDLTILRFGTLYGLSPRMRFDLVVNTMTGSATMDKKIFLNGGNQWRPFTHVKDASAAIIKALTSKNLPPILNVVSENMKIKKVADIVKSKVPDAQIENTENLTGRDGRDYKVSSKLFEKYGFKPKYKVSDGVDEIIKSIDRFDHWTEDKYSNHLWLLKNGMTL